MITINAISFVKLAQYNEYLIRTLDTDSLVLWHQGISSHSAEYAVMHFPVFMGQHMKSYKILSRKNLLMEIHLSNEITTDGAKHSGKL